jgi:DNA-binding beta-propeller fold protein YncE
MRVGSGPFVYNVVERWGQLPNGWRMPEVPAVAVDSQDRVYAFCRGEHPVIVLDREGHFLTAWGEGLFKRPHGIFIGPDDAVYCVDDWGHAVRKFTPEGKPLLVIETADHPADTGYVWDHPETVFRSGPPFNHPTGVALSPEGDLYVTDGYGNARVHRFAPDGRLLFSWGEPGDGPGQFNTPHGVCVDKKGLVYIADRENQRIQIFSPQGEFITQWRDVRRPDNMCLDAEGNMYVAELGLVMQGDPENRKTVRDAPSGRITVRDLSGGILTTWGATDPQGADVYYAPHGIAIDSRDDLYVGEVPASYSQGAARADRSVLRKYVRS